MGRFLFLDGNSNLKRRMTFLDEGRESLAKPARASKQIDDAELGRHTGLLRDFNQPVYTRFTNENQDACDRYCRPTDPFSNDGGNKGPEHQARANSKKGFAR